MPLTIPSKIELDAIAALIDFDRLRVLEIGAGDGRLSYPLAGPSGFWLGVDRDIAELTAALEDPRRGEVAHLCWAGADAAHLPLADSSIDLIFEHRPDLFRLVIVLRGARSGDGPARSLARDPPGRRADRDPRH